MPTRFVVISDTHFVKCYKGADHTWWNRTTDKFSGEMADALVKLVRNLSPDFIIHCGDFIGDGSPESIDFGLQVMDRLNCPWYGTPGNHDSRSVLSRAMFKKHFRTGNESWSYVRTLGDLRFYFVDVVRWIENDGSSRPIFNTEKHNSRNIIGMGPSDEDLIWLDRELAFNSNLSILVTHAPVYFKKGYPLATLPYGKPVNASMTAPEDFVSGFIRPDEGRQRLLDIVQSHEHVIACLAGHWHINDAFIANDRLFLQTGSLREYPFEIRLIVYDGVAVHVSTHPLDVPRLHRYSWIEEWNNRWVRGDADVRDVHFIPSCHT